MQYVLSGLAGFPGHLQILRFTQHCSCPQVVQIHNHHCRHHSQHHHHCQEQYILIIIILRSLYSPNIAVVHKLYKFIIIIFIINLTVLVLKEQHHYHHLGHLQSYHRHMVRCNIVQIECVKVNISLFGLFFSVTFGI